MCVFSERAFCPGDLIFMFLGSKCDKEISEIHNKSIKAFNEFVVNSPGEDMERNLGISVQHVNDCQHDDPTTLKNPHDCMWKIYKRTNLMQLMKLHVH